MDKCLSLDLETASEVDLKQCGTDVYARHPSTRVLMLAYAVDDGAVHQWLPQEGPMPAKLRAALTDPRYLKTAFNATFERAILKHVLGIDSPIEQWEDTMVMANIMALPGYLDGLGKALKLGPEFQKDSRGKALINYFCKPRKPTKNKPWVWADHINSPTEWKEFCEYNVQDVVVERKARSLLKRYPIQPWEWDDWRLDQKINERGVPVDLELVNQAIKIAKVVREQYKAELIKITGLKNPGSVQQFLPWAQERGYPFSELRKDRIKIALNDFKAEMTPECVKALELRLKAEKSSLKKFPAMLRAQWDGVVRFMFQFSGAGRTGRWAGRIVQLQNLARGLKSVLDYLEDAREMVRAGNIELVSALWDNPLDVLSTLLRSAFCAPDGYKFVIADLSAIESRVIGWLAGCESLLDVFRSGRDTYQTFAVHLFGKPYDEITKDERNQAKPAVLGAGYRLGGGDIVGDYPDQKKTGLWAYAESMGIAMDKEQAHRAVAIFREVYPEIVQLWYDLENAISRVMAGEGPQKVGPVTFALKAPFLLLKLPSGRCLFYCRPKMERKTKTWPDGGKTAKMQLTYEGIHQTTKKWTRMETHGGKLVENCLTGDSLILTPRGWVPMVAITTADCVWDGRAWVDHDGVVFKGEKPVIDFGGVRLTGDHLIHVNGSWNRAEDTRYEDAASSFNRHFGAATREALREALHWQRRAKVLVGDCLRLRTNYQDAGDRVQEGQAEVLRLCSAPVHRGSTEDARNVQAPGLRGVAFDACQVFEPEAQGVQELRCERHHGLPAVAGLVRELLGRHGWQLQEGPDVGASEQQPRLQQEQLPLGNILGPGTKQARERDNPDAERRHASLESGAGVRHRANHASLPQVGRRAGGENVRQAGHREAVYDILNAGPNHCFTVLGADGRPFLAHNCVQAIANDILRHGLRKADAAGFPIVLHVHDEIGALVRRNDPKLTVHALEACMTDPPAWAKGLPLGAEGFESVFYKKG